METLNLIFTFVGWFILCGWGCSLLWLVWLIHNYHKTEKAFWDAHREKIEAQAREIVDAQIEERRKENANADSNT